MTLSHLTLDRNAVAPLYRQIVTHIQGLIVRGDLSPGTQLPTSRQLARDLDVGRITVVHAYDQLAAEGFIVSRQGSGTFVAELPPAPQLPASAAQPALSAWGQHAMATGPAPKTAAGWAEIDFGFGRIFPHVFPYGVWRKLLARYLSTDDTLLARYGSAAGFAPLRHAVADYVAQWRGVHCSPDQIVIVNGTQQAVDILARLLLNPGDDVVVETPGYVEAYELLTVYQARLHPVAVDAHGIVVQQIPADIRPKLAYVTPANQFPQGGTLSLARRLALLNWATEHDTYVLEDDYDSELRYDGHPVNALQGIDTTGRVIYLGTFSKVLFPALRLAYVILPQPLVPPFLAAKRLIDRGSPTLTQAAVADFLAEGHFTRHMQRLRQTYGERRSAMVRAVEQHLGDLARFVDIPAGLHVMVYLPAWVDEARLVKAGADAGLALHPGGAYHLNGARPSLLLAFSGVSAEQIDAGLARLRALIDQQTPSS